LYAAHSELQYIFQVNYNDGTVEGRDDATWQENLSDYNSDFSAPSGKFFMMKYVGLNDHRLTRY